MPTVQLIHWNPDECLERERELGALGYQTIAGYRDGISAIRAARAQQPAAIVVDLSRLPSHGRETARALRISKPTRMVPLVFVDGDPEKVKVVKAMLPDATYTTWGRIKTALPKAIAKPPKNPVVPVDLVSSKNALEKLGLKAGQTMCLIGAPPGFTRTLGPKPAKAAFTAKADTTCDLFVCFARSSRDLQGQLALIARVVDRQAVWLAWPKKAGKIRSELDGNIVRRAGLAAGFVDYKVCAIDETWSGLAFKRRKDHGGPGL